MVIFGHFWKEIFFFSKDRLRWYGTLKYGGFHEKFNFLKIQDLRPLSTCQKHFEMILPNFPLDEYEIYTSSNGHSNGCLPLECYRKCGLVLTYINETL